LPSRDVIISKINKQSATGAIVMRWTHVAHFNPGLKVCEPPVNQASLNCSLSVPILSEGYTNLSEV